MWHSCAASLSIHESIEGLALQVILKRIVVNILNKCQKTNAAPFVQVDRMTEREENVVRYMAGYVASKIKKKYPLHSHLIHFEKDDTTLNYTGDDLQDFTCIWSEQIDRGGSNSLCNSL